VLVVDDSADLADSLAATLELLGCEVRAATNGSAALLLLEEWQPRIAFIDLTMPSMSGMQLLERMRHHAAGQSITAIAMTGLSATQERARALEDGFDVFVQKPFDLNDLRAVLSLLPE
jgi:CheY-like chemotaxis protein